MKLDGGLVVNEVNLICSFVVEEFDFVLISWTPFAVECVSAFHGSEGASEWKIGCVAEGNSWVGQGDVVDILYGWLLSIWCAVAFWLGGVNLFGCIIHCFCCSCKVWLCCFDVCGVVVGMCRCDVDGTAAEGDGTNCEYTGDFFQIQVGSRPSVGFVFRHFFVFIVLFIFICFDV